MGAISRSFYEEYCFSLVVDPGTVTAHHSHDNMHLCYDPIPDSCDILLPIIILHVPIQHLKQLKDKIINNFVVK